MAVLVEKTPQKRYQTIGGVGLSPADQEQADQLDEALRVHILKLIRELTQAELMPQQKGQGSLKVYWKLGKALRDIVGGDKFPHKSELPLLWKNAKMYLPEELLYRDRGPHREHLWYCYRLGGYTNAQVGKMNWGEWVTIFDSQGINQEPRFDRWFAGKLAAQRSQIQRSQVRLFAPCINSMLGGIAVSELTDSELFNCYEAAWQIAVSLSELNPNTLSQRIKRKTLQKHLADNLGKLDMVMDGRSTPTSFAEEVLLAFRQSEVRTSPPAGT